MTNIASQALFIMNSTIVMEQSQALANQLLSMEGADNPERIEWLYRKVLGRPAGSEELEDCLAHLEKYAAALEENGITGDEQKGHSWQSLCRALLASNEFIYLD